MKNMMVKTLLFVAAVTLILTGCTKNDLTTSENTTLTDVAQTSSQLASGSSFSISGSSSTTTNGAGPKGMAARRAGGYLAGTDLLAPTDQLLAIVDAESAGDFRGFRMHSMSGATVTNYDASGNIVTLPQPEQNSGGPEGCSFSGKQFPKFDSLLLKVAKTVVDYGTGVTSTLGSNSITRAGKIVVTRTGDSTTKTEVITFESYTVNGATIEGTKTRVSTFDSATGSGTSSTTVTGGKITFSDGTVTSWTSTKTRNSTIVLNASNRPVSGQIITEGSTIVKAADGTVIYSHSTTNPIVENVACGRDHHGPVSGTVVTVYNSDNLFVDFGDGTCSNTMVTITLNGVVTTVPLRA